MLAHRSAQKVKKTSRMPMLAHRSAQKEKKKNAGGKVSHKEGLKKIKKKTGAKIRYNHAEIKNKKSKRQSTTYIANSRTRPHLTVQVGGVVEHIGCKSKVGLHVLLLLHLLLVDGPGKITVLALFKRAW